MSLLEALKSEHYQQAAEMIAEMSKSELKSDLNAVFFFQNLHKYVADIPLITALAHKGLIEMDIYELDDISTSVVGKVIQSFKKNDVSERLGAFRDFLQEAENLDEPVKNMNLMTFAIMQNVDVEVLKVMEKAGCKLDFLDDKGENYLHKVASRPTVQYRGEVNHARAYIDYLTNEGLDIEASNLSGDTPLLKLLKNNNCYHKETMEAFLEFGANPEAETSQQQNALELAVEHYNLEQCELLFNYGAGLDTMKQNKQQQSIVYRFLNTCQYTPSSTEMVIFTKLLALGFDLYQINKSSYQVEETPLDLILKKSPDYLEAVLDHMDVDLNTPDRNGNTALHKVCALNINFDERKAKDVYRKVKCLIKAGADVNVKNNEGQSSRDLAVQDSHKYMTVQYLLEKE